MPLRRDHQHVSSDIMQDTSMHSPIDPTGGGLPSQWTETAEGQVTATADDTDEAVLTVRAPTGSEASGDLVFEVQGETGQPILSVDPYGFVGVFGSVVDPSNGGGGLNVHGVGPVAQFRLWGDGDGLGTPQAGFFGTAPVAQPAAIADATDPATTMARLNDLLAAMRDLGLIDT